MLLEHGTLVRGTAHRQLYRWTVRQGAGPVISKETEWELPEPRGRRRLELFLAIVGCFAMAVAQPIFDVLGKNPGFLTAHGLVGRHLVMYVAALGTFLPLALAGLFLVIDRSRIMGSAFAGSAIGLCSSIFVLLVGRRLGSVLPDVSWPTVVVSVVLGALVGRAAVQRVAVRQFLALLSFGLIAFPAMFLIQEGVSALITAAPVDTTLATDLEISPILFVVFDELPTSSLMAQDESVDAHRFPNFGALANTSTWYRRATAASVQTSFAVPAILTGNLPSRKVEPVVRSYPKNLFTWLGSSGYELLVQQLQTRLCPDDLCREIVPPLPFGIRMRRLIDDTVIVFGHLIAPEALAVRLPDVDQNWQGFRSTQSSVFERGLVSGRRESVPQIVETFTAAIQATPSNRLYYLHLNLPHVPWKYLPSGTEYGPQGASVRPPGVIRGEWSSDEWLTLQGYQQHLLQTGYADRILGLLMKRLREVGLWDDAVVVVTADHGASFWPTLSRRGMAEGNAEDILEVPMFVKRAGQTEAAVDDRPAQTLDLVPTLAGILERQTPWTTDGRSLLRPATAAQRERFYVYPSLGMQRIPVRVSAEGRRRTLDRKQRHFGSGESASLFDLGRHAHLHGLTTSSFEIGRSAWVYRLLDRDALNGVRPNSGFVPARVWAELEGEPPTPERLDEPSLWLAIALNGKVQTTTRPFSDREGKAWLTALLPEDRFRLGQNEVEIFEIGNGELPELKRLRSTLAPEIELLQAGSGESAISISPPRGQAALAPIPVVSGAVRGVVEVLNEQIAGWAGKATRPRQSYDELFVFRGQELLYRGEGERRRDGRGPVPFSEFRLELSTMNESEQAQVRVFARVGDVASELVRVGAESRSGALANGVTERDESGRLKLIPESGGAMVVRRHAVSGDAGSVRVVGSRLLIEGWAAQRASGEPAVGFMVVANGKSLDGRYERLDAPGIADLNGFPEKIDHGFRIWVDLDQLGPAESLRLRVFAQAEGGLAGELQSSGRRLSRVVKRALTESR